jgi:SAM-dependent methyltransferase
VGSVDAYGGVFAEGALSVDSFDRVPYPELIHGSAHPDRLAIVGRLLSLRPAPIERCQVLELGCGTGLNLINIAQAFPASELTGIDASAAHAARGSSLVRATGLQNVTIRHQDICSFDAGGTHYDFIIAHGVYSWVAPEVRHALLRVIQASLAPQGIALVSYNTYPGWSMLKAMREMMLFHARHARDPLDCVAKGREIIGFLVKHLDPEASLYAATLANYKSALEEQGSLSETERLASILYDDLSQVNEPVFFHDFIRQAEEAELQYVAEADLRGSTPAGLAPDIVQQIKTLATDLTSLEQYMDFLTNRAFRQTLLCRKEVILTRTLRSLRRVMQDFYFWTTVSAPTEQDFLRPGAVLQLNVGASELATDHPLSKAALLVLASAAPRSLSWAVLVQDATAMTVGAAPGDEDQDVLSATLLRGFLTDRALVGLSTVPDAFTSVVSPTPRCAPLARLLAREGQPRAPNKRHERILLGPLAMELAQYLDGEHGVDDLRDVYERRRNALAQQETAIADVETTLESLLAWFARSALLDG